MSKNLNGKKILVLLAGFLSGDSRLRRHIRFFSECGLEVTVLSFDSEPVFLESGMRQMVWPAFRHAKRAGQFWGHRKSTLFYILKLVSIFFYNVLAWWRLGKHRFDFYLANDFDTLPAACWLASKLNGKVIYDSHELFAEQRPDTPDFYIQAIHRWERALLAHVDQVITVNASLAQELSARCLPANPPAVVLNVPFLCTNDSPSSKLPGSILFHGNLVPGRGLRELILAAADFAQVTLVLRGDGEMASELRRLVINLGLQSRVRIEPPVPVEQVIAQARPFEIGVVFLEPNCRNNEMGLPNKIFEYLHAGLAILANATPELRTIVEDENVGLCIPEIDPAAIRRALQAMLADAGKLRRYQENARQVASRQYHFDLEKENWRRIFDGLVAVERHPSCAAS